MLQWLVHRSAAPAARPANAPDTGSGRRRVIAPGLSALASTFLLADVAAAPDLPGAAAKSRFHLFHPTPRELMRELETDRPDQTESPITVDAGHLQVEADLLSYSVTERHGMRREELAAPVLNVKVGVLNQVDVQVVVQPYGRARIEDATTATLESSTQSGFGDTEVRTKFNLWGNDGGRTALAVMPFVHLPTGARGLSTDAVEGGVIAPFGWDLPAGFALGMMWEVDVARDADEGGYHGEFVQSLTISRGLAARLSAYVEVYAVVSTERDSDWLGMFDFGFNYLLHRNLKLDAGVNFGVTDSAPDWVPFLGVTWRY